VIKVYFTKRHLSSNPILLELGKNGDEYHSGLNGFWCSYHYSTLTDTCLAIVNGDANDHSLIKTLAVDTGIVDARTDLLKTVPPAVIQAVAASKDNEVSLADIQTATSTEDLVTRILQKLHPGHCKFSFDGKPAARGSFADDFTGTDADLLESRSGWTKEVDGYYKADIYTNSLTFRNDSGTGASLWVCTDQGSANQYVQAYDNDFEGNAECCLIVRAVDESNGLVYRLAGTGAAGARLSNLVAGSHTDLISTQGAEGYGYKIECDGNTIKFFIDTGGGFAQSGGDQTISDHNTETSAGFRTQAATDNVLKFDDFENGALGAAAVSPQVIRINIAWMLKLFPAAFLVGGIVNNPELDRRKAFNPMNWISKKEPK